MRKGQRLTDCEIRSIIGYLENERKRIWSEIPPWEESSEELTEILHLIEKLRTMVN